MTDAEKIAEGRKRQKEYVHQMNNMYFKATMALMSPNLTEEEKAHYKTIQNQCSGPFPFVW